MSYFKILGFEKEPFSTSPDPEFFYLSKEHERAMTNILIELRLRRGLSVILGDIGTGKTTLSRKLIQELKDRDDFIFNIVLDPTFESEELFLTSLARDFEINNPVLEGKPVNILDLRESFERFLFQKGVTENKIVTLIVDEAQKLSESSMEVLRVLLNYETNSYKLLQLVLLGQLELHAKIISMPNFFDRISFKYTLNPLDIDEVREMIEFRIRQAGYKSNMHIFLDEAIKEIYQYSRGYPRQITMFCHKALKHMVLQNKFVVDAALAKELIDDEVKSGWHKTNPLVQKNSY
ncbi:MAG: AAA family ATPase [Candidatus Omnitrophota bacterium]|nr:AAA family ATPase [Candidatus Omnitrophota bacterium]MBU1929189.1 AAA family ATPase [Candidatus Omnitrophota bacterium]MBU2035480.1 AAA family ATPase [Candidatus Omnitrophota bacterium]MBU2221813.1 AAA family ATPase [Candidatus Omnitrophota bacterium]MBU2258128.1 AAA family ATPase [Candidatus Omnitrophota bacterium]